MRASGSYLSKDKDLKMEEQEPRPDTLSLAHIHSDDRRRAKKPSRFLDPSLNLVDEIAGGCHDTATSPVPLRISAPTQTLSVTWRQGR